VLPIELTDGRVELRSPARADVDEIARLCQDPDIQEWTTVPSPYTRQDAVGFVDGMVAQGWAQDRARTWGIRSDGRLCRMIGLGRQPVRSAEIGYWMGAEHRGEGLLHAALHLVLQHAFAEDGMDLDRVEWRAYAGNWASWRAVWRVGFRFEAAQRLGGVQRGRRRDEWVGSLLREDGRVPVAHWPATDVTTPTVARG
jgi:RimJ/RimL family protein N-acetyltransferase